MLTDAVALVAFVNPRDSLHRRVVAAIAQYIGIEPLTITWPVWTEALYLLHRSGGYPSQAILCQMRDAEAFCLHLPMQEEAACICH